MKVLIKSGVQIFRVIMHKICRKCECRDLFSDSPDKRKEKT